jgi:beta-mannosidase
MTFSQKNELEWNFFHPIKKTWLQAGKCGSVQEKLIESKELPDPFYGENEKLFNWIEKYDWEFKSSFNLTEIQFAENFIELDFPGVDTYAKIYINDSLVLSTDNAFHPYILQVKPIVKIGLNSIKVIFTSPVNYHRKSFEAKSPKLPAPNDLGEIAVSSMSRKPQYQFGWDWALRMNTIGFLKPVQLRTYSTNRILLQKVDTKSIIDNQAKLQLSLVCAVKSTQKIRFESQIWGNFDTLNLVNGELKIDAGLMNPKLWWPRGQGDQHLYHDNWKIYDLAGKLIDSCHVNFGIKTSELIQEKDQFGTSFYLKINGKPIFCKGANYIPQEVFPSRITTESIQDLVEQMRLSHFNMVRVWGGGFYPDEAFFDACDRAGIMVWQDFMFACAMYPGDAAFLANVKQELEYQVPRISAHPSLVLFNGNNEVDVAWKNWGFQVTYKILPKAQKSMEEDYRKLFKNLIPSVVRAKSFIPYEHTSPLSNWGKEEYFNHGTQHYWGVWHGKDPIEDFGLKSGRFNAEYGFQSFPEFNTLLAFSDKKDWDLNSQVMKWHQKSYVGNGMIKKQSDLLFGESHSFEEFVYLSQLTQSKAVQIAVSSHRLGAPRCMGTLYWQLNDCWQAPTWSSIDYHGNWKALQYEVKKDFEDIAVLEKTEKIGSEKYFILSDQAAIFETPLNCFVYDLQGNLIFKALDTLKIKPGFQQEICLDCQSDSIQKINYILKIEWQNDKGEAKSRTFAHLPVHRTKALADSFQVKLLHVDPSKSVATIEIENQTFLHHFWIYSYKKGVRFSENFIDLLPGKHTIEIKFLDLPTLEDFGFQWL